jgi:hypothetical protein
MGRRLPKRARPAAERNDPRTRYVSRMAARTEDLRVELAGLLARWRGFARALTVPAADAPKSGDGAPTSGGKINVSIVFKVGD